MQLPLHCTKSLGDRSFRQFLREVQGQAVESCTTMLSTQHPFRIGAAPASPTSALGHADDAAPAPERARPEVDSTTLAPYSLISLFARRHLSSASEDAAPPPALSPPQAAHKPLAQPQAASTPPAVPPISPEALLSLDLEQMGLGHEARSVAFHNGTAALVAQLMRAAMAIAPDKGFTQAWVCDAINDAVTGGTLLAFTMAFGRVARLPMRRISGRIELAQSAPCYAIASTSLEGRHHTCWLSQEQLLHLIAEPRRFAFLRTWVWHYDALAPLHLTTGELMALAESDDGHERLSTLARLRAELSGCGFTPLQLRSLMHFDDAVVLLELAARCSYVFLRHNVSPSRFVELCHHPAVDRAHLAFCFEEQRGKTIFVRYDQRDTTLCAASSEAL